MNFWESAPGMPFAMVGGVTRRLQTLLIGIVQFLARLLLRLMYRVRVEGLERVPAEGPALLVINHPSFIDAVVVGAFSRRQVRFVMDHRMYGLPMVNFICRLVRVIPIAPRKEDPRLLDKAYDAIDEALAAGDVVAIFPEGKVTRDGAIDTFRPGVERILERRPVPVIPAALSGLWGSFFSFAHGTPPMKGWPRRMWARVELAVGDALCPKEVDAPLLRDRVSELRARA